MVKRLLLFAVTLIGLIIFLTSCAGETIGNDGQMKVANALGIDFSNCTVFVLENSNTHQGFHGDGTTYISLQLSSMEKLDKMFRDFGWTNLPLNTDLSTLIYGYEDGERGEGPYICDDDGNSLFPKIQNGYYYFEDRHSDSSNNFLERGSFNLTVALFNCDTNTLHFCEFDT